jgi:hypothetical protein
MTATQPEGLDMTDELKQAGLDAHLRRLAEQEQGMKSEEEDVKPHGWKGNPDISPAAPAQSGEPVAWFIADDNGEVYRATGYEHERDQWRAVGHEVHPLYASPQPAQTAQSEAVAEMIVRKKDVKLIAWSKAANLPEGKYKLHIAAAQPAQTERALTMDEYHEDYGNVVWWTWEDGEWLGEPAWIGTPNDSDWPGYHTHWTRHPDFPSAALAKQAKGV